MSQSIIKSLFGDDPFFEDEYLLWPRRCSLAERFLQRREQVMDSLRANVEDRLISDLFQSLDELFSLPSTSTSSSMSSSMSSSTSSSTASSTSSSTSSAILSTTSSASRLTGPSVLSLNTHGFSPEDIAVTVSGRKLEVKVAKPSIRDSSAPAGFSRSVELPEHINPFTLTCTLGEDGFLNIRSDVKEAEPEEQDVPVRYRTSLDFPLSKDTTNTEEKNN